MRRTDFTSSLTMVEKILWMLLDIPKINEKIFLKNFVYVVK